MHRHVEWLLGCAFLAACSSGSKSVKQTPPPPDASTVSDPLAALHDQDTVGGFYVTARYLDATDQPTGARFVHEATGFTFDYLRIDTAPQGFIWVNTFPTSDQGEPHTQEHLLLGKGDRGRRFGNFQAMHLAESSAFTEQWRTAYHFHTIAGHDAYWEVFQDQLDDLLNPDYTDEEIRREVANFGVKKDDDGKLELEEQGTVYNEMVRTYEQPNSLLWYEADRLIYGAKHPLALVSGGWPDDIRTMTPEDIRSFHQSTYYLGNMGVIGAFPPSMELTDVLDRTDRILDALAGRTGDAMIESELPPPSPAAAGTKLVVPYPFKDATNPSDVMLAWPANRALTLANRTLMELFLSAIAGDESTNLYKKLIDTKTRTVDTGATAVWSYARDYAGTPVYIGITGVAAAHLNDAGLETIRKAVTDELRRIADLTPGDPELAAIRERIANRLADQRRGLAKFMSSPPRFGFRGTSDAWEHHLLALEHEGGFDQSLTLAPQLEYVESVLAEEGTNPWVEKLEDWHLLDEPFALATQPSPKMRKDLDDARQARLDAELARLKKQYGTKTDAETLAKFQADFDDATRKLEAEAKSTAMPPFVDTPPMTLDDDLRYDVLDVAGTKLVASKVDSMTGGTVAVSLRLDAVPEAELPYLALLPTLLQQSGLDENGTITTSEDVKEALRREILSLGFYFDTNPRTGRVEMTASGSGTDLAETRKALQWMARLLAHPDWRVANLSRLRDVVDQSIQGYRNVMLGAEEGWVDDPPTIWWKQRSPLLAHTSSFLTQLHDLHRLRWMLLDPQDADVTKEVADYLRKASKQKSVALAVPNKGSKAAIALITEAQKDLVALLADSPKAAQHDDFVYLCNQMASDLERGAADALAHLETVRKLVVDQGNARAWLVASTANGEALRDDLATLLGGFGHAALTRATYSDQPFVADRLRGRLPKAKDPLFVGLVNPNTSSGVFLNSAPGTFYTDSSDDDMLDYLAANLYTGHGGHSIFMKTWAAGLAYSNGLRISLGGGRVRYYAERCPELPQTLKFVIGELQKAKVDPSLVDYAIAEAFSSRVAAGYEERAAAIADDLEDGITPEVVRGFRERLLALRDRDGLADDLFARMEQVYGRVLPGYGPASSTVDDGVFFVIGPDKQLDAYEKYLVATYGKGTKLWRLYPRDFWVPAT